MDAQIDSREAARVFGPYRLLLRRRVLLRGTEPVRIGSRALEILVTLVESAGRIVGKGELMARVWSKTVVEEGTLRVHVAVLRKILGGGQPDLCYIESVMGHGYRFVAPVTSAVEDQCSDAAQAPAATDLHNLPVPSVAAIGRTTAVCTLTVQLAQRRLVTVVGPAGVGKTTVAIATANQLRPAYPDGFRFLDLAPIAAPALLTGALPDLEERLRHKRMLLLLDNCEHVGEAAASLAQGLLRRLPGLQILATSREPLQAANELVLRLAPLELPPQGAPLTAAEALQFPAIQLFCERACSDLHRFELRDADVPVVTDICRRLEGLPLAIGLAAARVGLLGVHGLRACFDLTRDTPPAACQVSDRRAGHWQTRDLPCRSLR
jgi:DNA-binding winged helix-turn-helix (wHTH) protein